MLVTDITLINPLGLHARAAAKLVDLTKTFASEIRITVEGQEVDGKSIMNILLLGAAVGTQLTIAIDGEDEPLRAIGNELSIPIVPGKHSVEINWQTDAETGFLEQSPGIDLGASSSNINLSLVVPSNRWVLFASGPELGPAILYWSELVALLILGVILGRFDLTPLKTHHWLLLGLGFSTFSWSALAIVVATRCGERP